MTTARVGRSGPPLRKGERRQHWAATPDAVVVAVCVSTTHAFARSDESQFQSQGRVFALIREGHVPRFRPSRSALPSQIFDCCVPSFTPVIPKPVHTRARAENPLCRVPPVGGRRPRFDDRHWAWSGPATAVALHRLHASFTVVLVAIPPAARARSEGAKTRRSDPPCTGTIPDRHEPVTGERKISIKGEEATARLKKPRATSSVRSPRNSLSSLRKSPSHTPPASAGAQRRTVPRPSGPPCPSDRSPQPSSHYAVCVAGVLY